MKKQKYIFEEIIDEIKEMYLKEGDQAFYKEEVWCLYSKNSRLSLKTKCYILPYPKYDLENDDETMPAFATQNHLELLSFFLSATASFNSSNASLNFPDAIVGLPFSIPLL